MVFWAEKAHSHGLMVLNTKETLEKTRSQERVNIHGQTAVHMKEKFWTGYVTAKENTSTKKRELNMLESGKMACATDMVNLVIRMAQFIKAIGSVVWSGVTVKWHTQAETTTKGIGKITSEMVMEKCIGCQATRSTLEIGLIISKADLEPISGLTKVTTTNFCAIAMSAIGRMDLDMEKELFTIQTEANMKVIGLKTLKTDTESLLSKTELSMTDHLNKIGWSTARLASRIFKIHHPNKKQPKQIPKLLKLIKKPLSFNKKKSSKIHLKNWLTFQT